jgi:hypothetical protein
MGEPSLAEQVWLERLHRKLGRAPLVADAEGSRLAHEFLRVRSSPFEYDEEEQWCRESERLGREFEQHQRGIEDEHAARLGLPPRPQ